VTTQSVCVSSTWAFATLEPRGQSSETVMATSMLPRVAFEYGHT